MLLAASFAATAQNTEKKAAAGKAADTASAGSNADSTLAKADSALILNEKLSAQDYMSKREKFIYPRTSRDDPFDFPQIAEQRNIITLICKIPHPSFGMNAFSICYITYFHC